MLIVVVFSVGLIAGRVFWSDVESLRDAESTQQSFPVMFEESDVAGSVDSEKMPSFTKANTNLLKAFDEAMLEKMSFCS